MADHFTIQPHHADGKGEADVAHTAYEMDEDPDLRQVEKIDYDPIPDKRDMRRLGKKQELKRRFRSFTIGGYIVILGLTWEFSLVTGVFGLSNGGTAGTIWLALVVCFGMFMCTMSLQEAASMAPTSGGQYHWVSEFAPPAYQKELSYAVGWMCAVGWQAGLPSVCYIGSQQVIALVALCKDDYVYQGWHGALMMIAWACAAIAFNTVLIGKLPLIEGLAVVLHIFGFFAFIIIIWVMGPRNDPGPIWTTFSDANNWGSTGLATLVGIIGPLTTYLGADAAVHLAEELENAAYILPRAMCYSALINYGTGFVMTVTFMQNITNLDDILASPTGQPWVGLILAITRSKPATIVLTIVMILLYFFCAVNAVTTSSRQLWSFARDKGLPFHRFLSRVRPESGVPANAVYVSLCVTIIFSLIVIGSTTAFNIILSVSAVGLLSSYIIVISIMLRRRLAGEPFPSCKWSLGHWGTPINIAAIAFLFTGWIFIFFPAAPDPDAAGMNWNVLIFSVVVMGAMIYYYVKGRFEYDGPVEYVRKDVE